MCFYAVGWWWAQVAARGSSALCCRRCCGCWCKGTTHLKVRPGHNVHSSLHVSGELSWHAVNFELLLLVLQLLQTRACTTRYEDNNASTGAMGSAICTIFMQIRIFDASPYMLAVAAGSHEPVC